MSTSTTNTQSTVALDEAVLGAGCFWCVEAIFQDIRGISDVTSGYTGGSVVNPTYEQVCTGKTGHAEVVRIKYDPTIVNYEDILRIFFTIHDPTTKDRQGNDIGTQYRSVIFTENDEQAKSARKIFSEIESEKLWPAPLVTQIEPASTFYPAEDYHADYFARNPQNAYCQAVVAPKVAKARKLYRDRLK